MFGFVCDNGDIYMSMNVEDAKLRKETLCAGKQASQIQYKDDAVDLLKQLQKGL